MRNRLLLLVAALAVLGAIAGARAWRSMTAPFKAYQGEAAVVTIVRGASLPEVARALRDAGIVRSAQLFSLGARVRGDAGRLQAGEYLFERPMSPWEVLDKILRGDVVLRSVTIPEGLSGPQVIERFARAGLATAVDLEAAFRDVSLVAGWDSEARDLEGYLFPETYRFARGTPARRIVGTMVGRFRLLLNEGLRERAARLGMTTREAVTLASLIERETSIASERPRISAVFHNRLRAGMPLQCDPTVIFALAAAGRASGELSSEDLAFVSPYNTYLNAGLPPGPIASPGRAAIEAAVSPAAVADLYFVADGTGGHRFSTSLAEHQRAVARYRRLRRGGA